MQEAPGSATRWRSVTGSGRRWRSATSVAAHRGDLVVGVPGENLAGADNAGMVHAIYGGSSGLRAVGSQLWSQNSPGIADAAETGDRFGAALATGDLTGRDGVDDVAIAAPGESLAGKSQAGVVHVLKTTRRGLSATASRVVSQDRAGVADAAEAGDRFGSVLAAGDLGNGAHADLVVGVPTKTSPPSPMAVSCTCCTALTAGCAPPPVSCGPRTAPLSPTPPRPVTGSGPRSGSATSGEPAKRIWWSACPARTTPPTATPASSTCSTPPPPVWPPPDHDAGPRHPRDRRDR